MDKKQNCPSGTNYEIAYLLGVFGVTFYYWLISVRTKCRMPSKYIWELNFFHTKITNFNCKTQADGYMCIVVQAAGSINPSAKCISLHSFIKFASLAYLKLTSTFGNYLVWVKSQLEEIRSLDNYISYHRAWSVLLSQFQTKHWTMNLRRGWGSRDTDR